MTKSVVVASIGAALLWGELMHRRSSRRRLGTNPGERGTGEAVIVLGYRTRGRRGTAVNHWRVRAGLRSQCGISTLVLCGGAVDGGRTEADVMADYARKVRGYTGPLETETGSRTTWENVQNAIPLIEHADRLKIVSNSLHAEKARGYLWKQRPDLAERLVRAEDYRFGELILLKPLLTIIGIARLRAVTR